MVAVLIIINGLNIDRNFDNLYLYIFQCCYRWYFRKIKRIEAEKKLLLPENEHGAFLIRDSESRHNDFSLSGNITSHSHTS